MKILLIEDRTERQKLFLEKKNLKLYKFFDDILFNAINDKYIEVFNFLKNEEYNFFKQFDIIISHKSAFENDNSAILFRLEKFSKENHKKLVFFSGGIDSITRFKDDSYEQLELHSERFYSKHLQYFLENIKNGIETNILHLAYGKKWKLNVLIEILENIDNFIQIKSEKNEFLFKNFYKRVKLEELKEFGFEYPFDKRNINKQEIIELKNSLSKFIEKESLK